MLDFDAGRYAPYVWPAYGLTAVVFLVMIAATLANARRWRRAVKALEDEHGDGEKR